MRLGAIEFVAPPLVEGPRIVFFIPLPEALHKIPFAMEMANGQYGLPVSITVVTTWFIILALFLIFKCGTKRLELIPGKLQILLESVYEFLDGIVEQMLGSWKKKYFSYISTLFLFIFLSNIVSFFPIPWYSVDGGAISFAPAFRAPTAFAFLKASIKTNGIGGYLKGFAQPIPVMLPLNIIGELAKPVNISVRLFGNMFAGGVIMGLLYMAVPWGIPAPLHLYFDLFMGLVQCFVFIMLSMVYIQGALGDSEYVEN